MAKPDPSDAPWREPLHDPGPVVIFDIDGVLADMSPHQHFITADRSRDKDWKAFHNHFVEARPIKAGLVTARRIYNELDIDLAYSTTRPEQFARRTLYWMRKNRVPMGPVQFRHFIKDGPRSTIDVKLRHWWYWQAKYESVNPVLAWIEDDPAALSALRANGCPAWGIKELRRASKTEGSLKAALERGPVDKEVLAANRERAYPQWRAAEDEWQAKRKLWWQKQMRRRRGRR